MLFGDNSEAARTAVEAAKEAVRSTANFDWTFIALLALVVCGGCNRHFTDGRLADYIAPLRIEKRRSPY